MRNAFTRTDLDFSVMYLPDCGGIRVLDKQPDDRLPVTRYEAHALDLTAAERRRRNA